MVICCGPQAVGRRVLILSGFGQLVVQQFWRACVSSFGLVVGVVPWGLPVHRVVVWVHVCVAGAAAWEFGGGRVSWVAFTVARNTANTERPSAHPSAGGPRCTLRPQCRVQQVARFPLHRENLRLE